jgi:hypothetical protein
MSALRSLAYGLATLAECSTEEAVELKRAARVELEPFKLWIGGAPETLRQNGNYALTTKVTGAWKSTYRRKPLFVGSFESCCDAALRRIEPENYQPSEVT